MPAKPKPAGSGQLTSPQTYPKGGQGMASSKPTAKPMPPISNNYSRGGKAKGRKK